MGVHPLTAVGARQDALQFRVVKGFGSLFVLAVMGSAFFDNAAEGVDGRQEAAATVAITNGFVFDLCGLQRHMTDGTGRPDRLADHGHAIAGFLGEVIGVAL